MRDFQLQTPQRNQASANRRSKSTSDVNRNLRKITKKSLNPVFQAVSEEDSSVSNNSKEISEDFDDNSFSEFPENFDSILLFPELRCSNEAGPSKKLLDALINVIIEEFYDGLSEEKETEWLDKLLSTRANLVSLSYMLGIFVVFIFWFSNLGAEGFGNELTPT
ncbi:hypothetical protein BUALT_Bualt14G0085500 [Buddleja alternifolia]|uniref:Uncharacterized protein n=1 Tax=Buddleja alternifolia TaxID=168488 RepID=A0AAV6WHZ5_9LAMI|nr:hypothetical protein BUALT_Bualt14G0085500 [Buddleja alternifolia]